MQFHNGARCATSPKDDEAPVTRFLRAYGAGGTLSTAWSCRKGIDLAGLRRDAAIAPLLPAADKRAPRGDE
jgi:hypothetical protein